MVNIGIVLLRRKVVPIEFSLFLRAGTSQRSKEYLNLAKDYFRKVAERIVENKSPQTFCGAYPYICQHGMSYLSEKCLPATLCGLDGCCHLLTRLESLSLVFCQKKVPNSKWDLEDFLEIF